MLLYIRSCVYIVRTCIRTWVFVLSFSARFARARPGGSTEIKANKLSLRKETSLVQLSSKYIGPKIWSDISENFKSLSPQLFEKQYKEVLLSCQNSCWFLFHRLPLLCNIVFSATLFPYIFYLAVAPQSLDIGMLFPSVVVVLFTYFVLRWFFAFYYFYYMWKALN